MSGSVPSFIQPSDRYEDLIQDDELLMLGAPINATPISQAAVMAPVKVESTGTDKRRLSQISGSLASTPETGSSKKVKVSQQKGQNHEVEQF